MDRRFLGAFAAGYYTNADQPNYPIRIDGTSALVVAEAQNSYGFSISGLDFPITVILGSK